MYSYEIGKRQFRFEKVEVGDFIKFKTLKDEGDTEYSIFCATVSDVSRNGYLTVHIDPKDRRLELPVGMSLEIDRRAVLQIYPKKLVEHFTPRLALKHLWKDLVFREVKTTKCNILRYAEYRYIGKTGFERIKRFSSLEDAYRNVAPEYHSNICFYYDDFFGFTNDKALRNNDHHYDREIFFSKKCYTELDWSDSPTGDFMIQERGFNSIPVTEDDIICGIVENGEKGLFYRKWFVCSKQFLTLWTMVCEPNNSSLMETVDIKQGDWIKLEKKKQKIKNFNKLLKELDTSEYSVDLNLNLDERRTKRLVYNLERAALFYPNRYKQIAEILFSRGFLCSEESYSMSDDTDYSPFQRKLLRNLLWPKRIKNDL